MFGIAFSSLSFKKKLDLYLSTVSDIPCQPGFNNSLDHGDSLRWQTPRDAGRQLNLNKPNTAKQPKLSKDCKVCYVHCSPKK